MKSVRKAPASAINDIRRLWSATTPDVEKFADVESELQGYFAATIYNLLEALERLDQTSQDSPPDMSLRQEFQRLRPQMIRQLRLLSEIGRVLFPDDFVSAARGDAAAHDSDRVQ